MISDKHIKGIIDDEIKDSNLFLVDLKINKANIINVFIDSMKGVTIEECAALSSSIREKLNKYLDDYALEVSSPGLDKSLVIPLQFEKNIGRDLNIITKDGIKTTGRLTKVLRNGIEIESEVTKGKKPDKKKMNVIKKHVFDFGDIKSAKVVVLFN